MTKVIRNFSNKLVDMELENKNPPKKIQQAKNRKFNPQYRITPLQIRNRERKNQDQVKPPLYIEEELKEGMEEALKFQEKQYSTLSQGEGVEVQDDDLGPMSQIGLDEEEIDEYCRKFTNLMQGELHKKYDLRSRRRQGIQDQIEEQPKHPTQQPIQEVNEKGKKPFRTIPVQQGETSKSQQIKVNKEKHVQ